MYLIGLKDFSTQTVLTDGVIEIGDVYRKYCRKNRCGTKVFNNTNTGVTLNWDGIYHITATFVCSGTETGDVSVQLYENGSAVSGATASATIATADTEQKTLVLDYFALVDTTRVLNCNSTVAKTLSFVNTGIGATYTSVTVNIEKEV